MDKRKNSYTISRPQLLHPQPEPHPPTAEQPQSIAQPSTNGTRPLSDIRELSEPSLIDVVARRVGNRTGGSRSTEGTHGISKAPSTQRAGSLKKGSSANPVHAGSEHVQKCAPPADDPSSSYSSTPEQSSFYAIPQSSVPRRSSSQTHAQCPIRTHARKPSIRGAPVATKPSSEDFIVANRGPSYSPVKLAGTNSAAVQSDTSRRIPSRTLIRSPPPNEILDFPSYRYPRVDLELQTSAPLFVGGGSIEGKVKVTVDANERTRSRRTLAMGALSIDLIGFEDMANGRRATFLALGTELIDTTHPPPANMVEPPNPLTPGDGFWTLVPSTSTLPFRITLPLDTGPPAFQSRTASIRFLLCSTALISDAGKHYRVRVSQDVSVLSTYDPEKALNSLPSPLTAGDELSFPRLGRCETLKVTAGLHRQVWVSGSSIFVDVHMVNTTHKSVGRLELNLERDVLCYKHSPAGTSQRSASQARVFESNEQTLIARSSLNSGQHGWAGVQKHTSETRTCELELPRGHATVRCGKYFEVRFFLNVTASISNTKLVSVQLPIILIHMNSLDVLPNSVAQVAAAIEEKRAQEQQRRMRSRAPEPTHTRQRSASSPAAMAEMRRRASYSQGRAFAAPIQQSTDRLRAMHHDIDDLRRVIDCSPRKFDAQAKGGGRVKKQASNTSFHAPSIAPSQTGYRTPPSDRSKWAGNSLAALKPADRSDPLLRMQSFDSLKSRALGGARRRKGSDQNSKPRYNFTVLPNRIEPHTLGLSNTSRRFDVDREYVDPSARPATSFGFRERLDRKKFEFKGIKPRMSGNLRERSLEWMDWSGKNRGREKDGWI